MAGTAVLLAVALGALSRSDLFHVRRIEVTGATHLTVTEIVRLSGLSTQTNAIWADTSLAARRLETDPWIAGAVVERDLPFTIRIQVRERTPVAIVEGQWHPLLIAGDGTTLGQAPAGIELPVIVPPPHPALSGPAPDLAGPAKALGALPPRIREMVRRVMLGADGTVRMALTGGLVVDYGWTDDVRAKASALAALLSWARGRATTLRGINLVAPDAPTAVVGT